MPAAPAPAVVSREEWEVARAQVAELELAEAEARDRSTAARRDMPAVRIDLGCVTRADDAAALADDTVLGEVAHAIVVAVQRVYLAPEEDSPTGLLSLEDLKRPRESTAEGPGSPEA